MPNAAPPSPSCQFELHPQSDNPLFEFPPIRQPTVCRSTHNEFLPLFNKKCLTTSPFQSNPPFISVRSTFHFNLIHPLIHSNRPSISLRSNIRSTLHFNPTTSPHLTSPPIHTPPTHPLQKPIHIPSNPSSRNPPLNP